MKKLLFLTAFFISSLALGQVSFNTGSAELDADLNAINVDAKLDLGSFKADLSVEFGVPATKIDGLFSIGMEAGEVYLSLEIAKISKKSVDEVAECYKSNKSKGWGFIAKEMGIKPGSAEFHELKGKTKTKKGKGKSGGNKGNGNSKNKKK